MDWGNVTAEDLIDALHEVDWSSCHHRVPSLNSFRGSPYPDPTLNGIAASNATYTSFLKQKRNKPTETTLLVLLPVNSSLLIAPSTSANCEK
ncbi:hypothetical protein K1719_017198 [Acacia pycnantha]|nr:hypothetical protein K1719_017198 [Acacia pycnantha]